jgi:magnesium transporter
MTPTIKEQKAVEEFMELHLQTRQQIEEIESTSKYSETENAIIANSNFFVQAEDGAFAIEPVSFIVSEGVLISHRNEEFRTFTETAKRLQMNWKGYPTGYHLLILLLEVRIDFDADLVEALGRKIAELGRTISTMDRIDRATIRKINHLQENTMLVRENIFDRQRILSGILRSERFPNDIYPKLSLMIKDVNSLLSHADFDSARLDYMQESTLGLMNVEQNSIMRVFTVAMLIFMPGTLLTGIWGMNFENMPELAPWFGYPLALSLIFTVMISVFIWVKKKKWL